MAGGTFSILRSVRGYHIYKEICSQGKFRANKFSRLKFREFEPFAKIAKISPREFFPPYGINIWPKDDIIVCFVDTHTHTHLQYLHCAMLPLIV